ncbi:MAG: hypothetical protein ACRDF7_00305 [Candidatus Limnocylindrales bacterium]
MSTTGAPPILTIDTKYGGPYAGSSVEVSEAAAAHFNAAAANAAGVLPGEYVEFVAGDYFSIACPTLEMDRHDFIAAYQRLRAVIDDDVEIVLSDHPRLFSTGLDHPDVIRGVPTYIPKARMADGFFGRAHRLEVFQGDQRIAGPGERFFHSATSGVVFDQIEDAHGRLIVEMRGDLAPLARRGEVVFFTDPAFGEPTGVVLVESDGSAKTIGWDRLGWDRVGETTLFLEWVAVGVRPSGRSATLEVSFAKAATGLAVALYSGHTRDTAFRVDATVLPAPG